MTDRVESLHGSLIQHGPHNRRIYVMRFNAEAATRLLPTLDRLAEEKGYGKICAKIPVPHWRAFRTAGYIQEAVVPGFYSGRTDGLFVGKFFSARRRQEKSQPTDSPPPQGSPEGAPGGDASHPVTACTPADIGDLSGLYRQVFASYPFPIQEPGFINQAMRKHVYYFGVRIDRRLVAAAAAESHPAERHCEMTDFATLPAFRGRGCAGSLLDRLQEEARRRDLITAYTIARADSPGINRIFTRRGYRYAGRLVKNSQIGGRIRSMNVWYRRL